MKFFLWVKYHTEGGLEATDLDAYSNLEEAWQNYNKRAAEHNILEVVLMTPIKEFKR